MYKTILVPLDGSHRAEAILPHAQQLAILFEAELIFLQVFELPHLVNLPGVNESDFQALPYVGPKELGDLVEEVETYLSDKVQFVTAIGIPSRFRIAYGPIASSIINTAVDEEVDLIAMASHGSGGLQGVYYGSVAAGVLQRVDRPLLIVRSHESQ